MTNTTNTMKKYTIILKSKGLAKEIIEEVTIKDFIVAMYERNLLNVEAIEEELENYEDVSLADILNCRKLSEVEIIDIIRQNVYYYTLDVLNISYDKNFYNIVIIDNSNIIRKFYGSINEIIEDMFERNVIFDELYFEATESSLTDTEKLSILEDRMEYNKFLILNK